MGHLWTQPLARCWPGRPSPRRPPRAGSRSLPAPVAITANTTYVASYHTDVGYYALNEPGFTTGVANPPLRALARWRGGAKRRLQVSGASGFPIDTYNASNYWADVVFSPSAPPPPSGVPILVVTRRANPSSRYYRRDSAAEAGLNSSSASDIRPCRRHRSPTVTW